MAAARTSDTGAEVKPVEFGAATGLGDGVGAAVAIARDVAGDPYVAAIANWLFAGANGWRKARVADTYKNVAAQAIAAGTPVTIWTPAAGRRFRLMGFCLSTTVAGAIIFKYGAGNTEFLRTPLLVASTPFAMPLMGEGRMPGVADEVLKLDLTVTGNVSGFIFGMEE